MRYTENKYDNEIKDLFDIVRIGFMSILTSPYRLLSEISTKIMFLDRAVVEKTLVVSAIVDVSLLMFSFIEYLITGEVNLLSGIIPIIPVAAVLLITAVLAWLVSLKFEGHGTEVSDELTSQNIEVFNEEYHIPVIDFSSPEEEVLVPQSIDSSSQDLENFFNRSGEMVDSSTELDDHDMLSRLVNPSDLSNIDISEFFNTDFTNPMGELDKEILRDLVSSELNISKLSHNEVNRNINRNKPSRNLDNYKEELLT